MQVFSQKLGVEDPGGEPLGRRRGNRLLVERLMDD